MKSEYQIEPAMLGPDATDADADRMVELLRDRGYNAVRGHAIHNPTPAWGSEDEGDYPPEQEWMECLNLIYNGE